MKFILIAAAILVVAGSMIYFFSLEPSHHRDWLDYYDSTPNAVFEADGSVILRLVRDWEHNQYETTSKTWLENVRIHPREVSRVWFLLAAIGDSKYVAHSFLVFELEDGRAYAFSIEARREVDEPYSPLLGIFRKYELAYTWGTERDFVGVRLFLLKYRTEIYPLNLSPEEAGGVFLAMARATAAVHAEPRFYNTLTANCTNLLAESINLAMPGRLPYHPAWNLPALSVGYLIDQGLIDVDHGKVKDVRDQAVINGFIDELLEASGTTESFSDTLRSLYFENR